MRQRPTSVTMGRAINSLLLGVALAVAGTGRAEAQSREDSTVSAAQAVVKDLVEIPLKGIPRKLLADSQAVAIIPNVIKGSFVIGARHGNGVLLVRAPDGNWHAPVFISLTGGNVGWQVGVQSTDVVLVFKTRKSAESLLSNKLTLGGDAAIAAGPVGREVSAATDARLGAEIYSYSRSRGLFAGVSIDGSVLRPDSLANAAYYRSQGLGKPVIVPEGAAGLAQLIATYCSSPDAEVGGPAASAPLEAAAPSISTPVLLPHREDELRAQLAQGSPALYKLLDPPWQSYLALPSEVFVGKSHPTADALRISLANFEAVDRDPRYRKLADLPEFKSTHALLRQYASARENQATKLDLPPPPATRR